jgi:hypothetical protein
MLDTDLVHKSGHLNLTHLPKTQKPMPKKGIIETD